MRLVLVHSPYLSPLSWEPTAVQLRATGHAVDVPDLRAALRRPPCVSSFIAEIGGALDSVPSDRAVLVGHSRAGPFLPAAAHRRSAVTAMVYVDAALPCPGRSWTDQAPPRRVAEMRHRLGGERLPRWSDWWDDASAFERLVPDPTLRGRLIEQMPRVPSSFLDERLPDLDWEGPAGFLQLSAAYAAVADTAQDAGWVVASRELDHLAISTAPVQVAEAIATLVNVLVPTCD